MPRYKYKNKSDQKQIIIDVGEIEAGAEIEVEKPIENPNFELIKSNRFLGIDPATTVAKRGNK